MNTYSRPDEGNYEPEVRFYTLFKTQEKFYIQPYGRDEALTIDRLSHDITKTNLFSPGDLPPTTSRLFIYGVIGMIRLISGPYLLVITKATKISHLDIYRLDQAEAISFSTSELHMNEEQINLNQRYLSMLNSFLSTKNFYFSYYYDLTNSLQKQCQIRVAPPQMNEEKLKEIIYNNKRYYQNAENIHNFYGTADTRFVWNNYALSKLVDLEYFYHYCPILMLGAILQRNIRIEGREVVLILISRRSVRNAGTRFNCRGTDQDGNVSNFVETEQILIHGDNVASLVQVRGSIPLLWKQNPNLKYKPVPEIELVQDHAVPMHKHLDELTGKYGMLSIVNLVDHKGFEGRLERMFSDEVRYLSTNYYTTLYHSFDFHKECSKMRWYRLKILMEEIQQELEQYSYFHMSNGSILSKQVGIIRTNCIDSLDRTNVVQSMISKIILEHQLRLLRTLSTDGTLEDYASLHSNFQDIWASNADILSIQYAGTPALKTDFTRIGRRTKLGVLKDGINSLTRYFKNNFADGHRQDSYDLFLGKYVVSPTEGFGGNSPLQKQKNLKQILLPSFLLGAISLLFFSLLATNEANLFHVLFLIGLVGGSFMMVMKNGSDLVDKPRLREHEEEYNTGIKDNDSHQS